ncbi:MAG: BspA family leucine-rich repeat surface protein [Clostridia bacterium]|nr:BspA family leucine-rich repeat surface protein [Clostridia bacterium]
MNKKENTNLNVVKSKKVKSGSSGITLIALIITIVIMLILAGITINLTLGENGIFIKAKDAKLRYKNASAKEKLEMDLVVCQMGGTVESTMEEYLLGNLNGLEMYSRLPYKEKTDREGNIVEDYEITAQTTEAAVVVDGKVYCVYVEASNKIKVYYEDGNVMMADKSENESDFWLKTNIMRNRINTIIFENQIPSLIETADSENINSIEYEGKTTFIVNVEASGHEKGSVKAWWTENDGKYDIVIAGNGGVISPRDSKSLFSTMKSLSKINFKGKNQSSENFSTEYTTSMENLFCDCHSLIEIIFSEKFTTKNITNLQGVFARCGLLESLDLRTCDFDTTNVKFFTSLFLNCGHLNELYLGEKFNMENAISTSHMFCNCESILYLDLSKCNIDINNIVSTENMFLNTNNCEIIVHDSEVREWLLSGNNGNPIFSGTIVVENP